MEAEACLALNSWLPVILQKNISSSNVEQAKILSKVCARPCAYHQQSASSLPLLVDHVRYLPLVDRKPLPQQMDWVR